MDVTEDSEKHFMIWGMFMSSTLEASAFMGRIYSDNLHSIKNTGEKLTLKKMFEISEQLILEKSDEFLEVSQISLESSPWKQLSLYNDEEFISLSHAKVYVFSVSVLCSWKDESESNIKYCLLNLCNVVAQSSHHSLVQ